MNFSKTLGIFVIIILLLYSQAPGFQITQNLCISWKDLPEVYYRVRKGDSLWKIAKKFHTSVKKLKKLNNLKRNIIHPGDIIKVKTLPQKQIYGEYKTVIKKVYYRVRKGDSLWKIAKKFHTSVKKLKKLNNLKRNIIHPGEKLLIKIYKKRKFIRKYIVHRVKKGESLFKIALKYGVSLKELKQFNGLKRNFLIVGQLIKIPLPVKCSALRIFEKLMEGYHRETEEFFGDLGIGPLKLAPREKEEFRKILLDYAFLYKNYKYKYGGTGKHHYIDCSMFTKLVFRHLGIELPRTAREQYRIGFKVPKDELIPGDLVFFKAKGKNYPAHVGIYIGDGKFIHFSSFKKHLAIDSLYEPYFRRHFIGARRVIGSRIIKYLCTKKQEKRKNKKVLD